MFGGYRLLIIAVVAVVGLTAGLIGCQAMTRHHVQTMLGLKSFPSSVSKIDCASFGVTDVLERCSFEIASADFGKLLAARAFAMPPICSRERVGQCVEKADAGMSHAYCCGPKTGDNFHIATTYVAKPPDAENGGQLTVLTNATRTRVMVDLYVE